jgi:hypothetical protein
MAFELTRLRVKQALIPGSTVYEVWAQDSPYNDPSNPQLIGTITLNSKGFTYEHTQTMAGSWWTDANALRGGM